MADSLSDEIVIVTGAGSGIGREMAKLFHEEGAKLVLVDVVEKSLNDTVDIIGGASDSVHSMVLDLRKPETPMEMINATVDVYGRVDIVCNNAGIMDGLKSVTEVSDDLWNKVMDVNLNAPFRTIRAVIPHMLKQGHGVILNTASIAGLYGGRAGVAYTASKHALIGLTKHTASFYADDGIRCNAMALGAVATNIGYGSDKPSDSGMKVMQKTYSAMPEPANPADIARVALFLVSDQSVSINGSIVVADGGWTVY